VAFDVVQPSENAQLLVRSLLRVDPKQRTTMWQVLEHDWMMELDEELEQHYLSLTQAFFCDWGRT
jgi:serine/threonine protein kinase